MFFIMLISHFQPFVPSLPIISLCSPQYFVVVLLLLLIEFSVCVIITFWPQCLGLNLDEPLLVKALQANYGVPGKEQVA